MKLLLRIGRAVLIATKYLRQTEPLVLILALGVVVGALSFVKIADEMRKGETQQVDEQVLLWFRQPGDPAVVRLPWIGAAARDISGLGSVAVLALVVLLIVGFLMLARRIRVACVVLLASSTGALLSFLLKIAFDRSRPSIVPHLDAVTSAGFPSGHSMLSAIVYLTLAAVLAQILRPRRVKVYVLASAMLLVLLVGMSRIVLGVHYPTDVLAGWAAGLAWAFLWQLAGKALAPA